jgi:hypothetical protein
MTGTECWWEPRREGEPTRDYLARVLDDLGAPDLAARALQAHYDDYLCPPAIDDGANIHRLIAAVQDWSRSSTRLQRERAKAVVVAARDGEFDGTRAEASEWAASPDGQATFAEFLRGGRHG